MKNYYVIIKNELEFNKTENLTKENIKNCLFQRKIEVNNLLLTQVIIRAELEMRLCNGETKDHYTLFEKRIPSTTKIPREEAICKLAKTYFTSRGPATLKDFAWWSGLNMKDAKLGISGLGRDLCSFMLDNLCYYHFEIKNNFVELGKFLSQFSEQENRKDSTVLFNDLFFLFFSNGGSTFQWLSYYVFPNLKLKTAFIIGQIIYVPFLALLILSMIILFHFVFKRLNQIKFKKD